VASGATSLVWATPERSAPLTSVAGTEAPRVEGGRWSRGAAARLASLPAGGPQARPVVPRLPALEGLRAVAVAAVVLYHLPVGWLPGGFLGVDVFFVISGFLITSLLVAESARSGRIGLGAFYRRRARRLLPALVVMVVVVSAAAALFARDALSLLATDLPAVLGYVTNWWLVFHHVSYVQSVGRPPLVLHLWSLAVEEQFYLVWPLVVLLVVRGGRGRTRRLGWVALAGAAASSTWMAIAYHPSTDPSRVYFGTDTHAGGLLLGAALAVAYPPWERSSPSTVAARRRLDGLGLASLAALVALMAVLEQDGAFTYRGGLQLATAAAALLVLVASGPGLVLTRLLSTPVLQWLGRRSYAIYLWHWPVFELTRPGIDVSLSGWSDTVLRLALVLVAADLSLRLVEDPFRSGAAWRALGRSWARDRRLVAVPAAAAVAVVGLLALELVQAPPAVPAALAAGATASGRAPVEPLRGTGGRVPPATAPAATAPGGGAAPGVAPWERRPNAVLAIGDSVMLDGAAGLRGALGPATVVDAVVGRQVASGIERLAQYRAAGRLAVLTALVIGLGTNGPMTGPQCRQILTLAAGVPRVVFVNVRMPRPWEPLTNQSLATCTADRPGVDLVDWYGASEAAGVLGPDAIHASPAGAALYAALVAEAASCAPTLAQATTDHCPAQPGVAWHPPIRPLRAGVGRALL